MEREGMAVSVDLIFRFYADLEMSASLSDRRPDMAGMTSRAAAGLAAFAAVSAEESRDDTMRGDWIHPVPSFDAPCVST
jgi:hypothetical protein